MKKQILPLTLVCIIAFSLISLASASYVCPSAYTVNPDAGRTISALHPSSTSSRSAAGEAFTANTTCYLTSITVYMYKVGTPNALLYMKLYTTTGTVGTTAYPNAQVDLSTNNVNSTTLGLTRTSVTFTFDGTYHLISGNTYAWSIEALSGTIGGTSNVVVEWKGATADADKNAFQYYSSGWAAAATNEMYFIINADTVSSGATPTPTPAPTGTPTPTPDGMSTVINTVITPVNILMFIALCIIIIPAIIGAKFAGGWGFLAGLNVGVVLVVVFSVIDYALWIAVLIGMVDAVAVIRGMTGAGKAETISKGE